jgi:hypothetical protein
MSKRNNRKKKLKTSASAVKGIDTPEAEQPSVAKAARGKVTKSKAIAAGQGDSAEAERRPTAAEPPAPGRLPSVDHGRDPRLPPIGTTLVKRDRLGRSRCECTIEAEGIRYRSTLHRSLSAAASAAAVDLGIKGRVNGFVFWGLVKVGRPALKPAEQLRKIADRYEHQAAIFLQHRGDLDARKNICRELEAHTTHLADLLAKSAA